MKYQKIIIIITLLLAWGLRASAQRFVFRDYNQELLGLVFNVAVGFEEIAANFPVWHYHEYCQIYDGARDWLKETEAVSVLRSLLEDEIVDAHTLPAIGLVFRSGFTSPREEYLLPEYMTDPGHKGYERFERLIKCLRELYRDERFEKIMGSDYETEYKKALNGSEAWFDETGQVLEIMEETLGIDPPENFYNIFALLGTPSQNRTGAVQKSDGSLVAYDITGITYGEYDDVPSFDIDPELFLNLYAFSIVDNARIRRPEFAVGLVRLAGAKIEELVMATDGAPDMETYMLGNASTALTAYMFGVIGNRTYRDIILAGNDGYYLYAEAMVEILDEKFTGSGKDFYEFFPEWFTYLAPLE
ncbi:MAG: hypothetical protein LIO77_08365 [Rikenellaceae bacterium]|nr:hypothetical protein [Rikenellaceae bacterium]